MKSIIPERKRFAQMFKYKTKNHFVNQPTFPCSTFTMETPKQRAKFVQSEQ